MGYLLVPAKVSPQRAIYIGLTSGILSCAGQVPVYAPTRVKELEGKDAALVRSGQHHTLVLTKQGECCCGLTFPGCFASILMHASWRVWVAA